MTNYPAHPLPCKRIATLTEKSVVITSNILNATNTNGMLSDANGIVKDEMVVLELSLKTEESA
ncbi:MULTISPECIES: hypothetical protein [unclassified Moraxella]|uniref:hypothetical protein n=1 Tax=unclassified Moraxella TaxID=2685852 RepID=UPI00359D6CD4